MKQAEANGSAAADDDAPRRPFQGAPPLKHNFASGLVSYSLNLYAANKARLPAAVSLTVDAAVLSLAARAGGVVALVDTRIHETLAYSSSLLTTSSIKEVGEGVREAVSHRLDRLAPLVHLGVNVVLRRAETFVQAALPLPADEEDEAEPLPESAALPRLKSLSSSISKRLQKRAAAGVFSAHLRLRQAEVAHVDLIKYAATFLPSSATAAAAANETVSTITSKVSGIADGFVVATKAIVVGAAEHAAARTSVVRSAIASSASLYVEHFSTTIVRTAGHPHVLALKAKVSEQLAAVNAYNRILALRASAAERVVGLKVRADAYTAAIISITIPEQLTATAVRTRALSARNKLLSAVENFRARAASELDALSKEGDTVLSTGVPQAFVALPLAKLALGVLSRANSLVLSSVEHKYIVKLNNVVAGVRLAVASRAFPAFPFATMTATKAA